MTENYVPLQTSKYFPRPIQRYGCYFLSIIWGVCEYLKKPIRPFQVMEIFEEVIEKDFMTTSCYIKNPGKVGTIAAKVLGRPDLKVRYVGTERDGKLDIYNEALAEKINITIDNIQIMWENKAKSLSYGSHFINGKYNPDPRFLLTDKIFGHRYLYIGE
jgi:hypothetical protein